MRDLNAKAYKAHMTCRLTFADMDGCDHCYEIIEPEAWCGEMRPLDTMPKMRVQRLRPDFIHQTDDNLCSLLRQ